jgi:signal transduction histidine kinase
MATDPPPPRTRSARLTLVSLLLIPLLSLVALWGFTASITLGNVIRYQHYNAMFNTITGSVTSLEETLPVERALTLVWLGGDRRSTLVRAALVAARRNTDRITPQVRSSLMAVHGLFGAAAVAQMNIFLADLSGLGQIRAAVDSGADDTVAAFNAYTSISIAEYEIFQILSPSADPELSLMTQAAIAEAQGQEFTGGAVSLIEGALARRGLMTQPERVLFAQMVGQQNLEVGDMFSLANPTLATLFARTYDSPAYRSLRAIENQIEASPAGRPIPVNPATFQATAQAFQAQVTAGGRQIGLVLAAQSARLHDRTVTELYLAGGLGLAAVLASVFVMVRFGRRLRVELTNLYDSARQMANERLPRLVERLRRGDDVDVQAESPPMKAGRITEIANVAQALSSVQRTAVEAAVGQASLRKGVNQVFVHLSLRNQSLLHRQLGMLDTMERGTDDPALLGDLFGLDHLTTRMQRYAESLLILAGATPGRGWRDPVPLVDVLQAAVAEVEDYVRVDVITESADAVAGIAVNDVIHLIAELVENATAFSPPNTRVMISGSVVGHGFAVEIEDRGLGIAPDALAAINEQLAIPPEFDLANSDQLGLFVTSKLAARHGIRVTLRMSPYRGTTAIVVLPWEIIVPEHEADAWFGSGGIGQLPTAAAHRERNPAFGMAGRHRLGLPPSPPEYGGADGTELVGGPQAPAADAASWFSVPSAAWAIGPAEPNGGSPAVTGSTGVTGSDPHPPSRPANGTAAGGTYRGLPRRVRQASLAPQLRGGGGGGGGNHPTPPPPPPSFTRVRPPSHRHLHPRRQAAGCPRCKKDGWPAASTTWTVPWPTPRGRTPAGGRKAHQAGNPNRTIVRLSHDADEEQRGAARLAAGQPGHPGHQRPPGAAPVQGWPGRGEVSEPEPRGRRQPVGPGRGRAQPGPRGRTAGRRRGGAADHHRDGLRVHVRDGGRAGYLPGRARLGRCQPGRDVL